MSFYILRCFKLKFRGKTKKMERKRKRSFSYIFKIILVVFAKIIFMSALFSSGFCCWKALKSVNPQEQRWKTFAEEIERIQ